MRTSQHRTSRRLAYAFAGCLAPSLSLAQATPGVDRLPALSLDQTDVTNASGAHVYQRMALDRALEAAALEIGKAIKQQCGGRRAVLVLDGAAQGAPAVLGARAAQASALRDLARIDADIQSITRRLDRFPPSAGGTGMAILTAPDALRIAPAMLDLVRVVDSVRFITSLTRTQYAFAAASTVSPTPGLVETTLLSRSGDRRLGDALSTRSVVLEAFDKADTAFRALEAAYARASTRVTKDNADALTALKKDADLVRSQLMRYLSPGANNAPSPLQQLVSADFTLPAETDCLVAYLPTVDATTITSQRAVFPTRRFHIDARATVIATFHSPAPTDGASASERYVARAHCTLEVDPKDRPKNAPACPGTLSPALVGASTPGA